MTFAIYNRTLKKWVKDADSDTGAVWTTTDPYLGAKELAKVNELKMLNPDNRHHELELKRYDI